MSQKIYSDLEVKGTATVSSIPNATLDTDKFLVSDGGLIKYRTGNELLADLGVDIGAPAAKLQHVVKAAVAINKGQAIYISGADGTNMLASLASNTSEATSSKTMGLLDATVAANGFANVVTEGLLAGLDTSTAIIGNPVWLGTNGNLIYGLINKPYAPAHLVFVGIVTRVNLNNGEIFVKVQNGFELDEIHDIDLKTTIPINGHLLGYNGTLWVNKTIAGWLGYTPADDSLVVHKALTETITGDKTFTGTTYINTSAISGREALLTASVSDNTTDKFFLANGTTTANRFIPTFVGYTSGAYQALLFRGLGTSADDLSDTAPYIQFLAANTSSSTDPNNGVLSTPTARDLFSWSTTGGTDYMKMKAGGIILINTTVNNGIDRLQIDGYTLSTGYKIPSGLSTWFLKADGSYDTNTYQTALTNPLTGTGTVNYVSKFTGTGSTLGNSLIFDNGTSVGIGTATPTNLLTVRSNNNATLEISTVLGGDNTTPAISNLLFKSQNGSYTIGKVSTISRAGSVGNGVMTFNVSSDINLSTIPEMMRIDGGTGFVGIGTTTPTQKLTIDAGTSGTSLANFLVTGGSGARIGFLAGYGAIVGATSANAMYVNGSRISFSNVDLSTEWMRIDSSGNVGIGTTTPSSILELNKTDSTSVLGNSSGALTIRNAETTRAAGSGRGITGFNLAGGNLTSTGNYAGVYGTVMGSGASGQIGSLIFATKSSIADTSLTERMSILASGFVGIGTTSPSTKLEVFSTDSTGTRTSPHDVLTLTAENGSTPYSGFGGGIVFKNRAYTSGIVTSTRIRSQINNNSVDTSGGSLHFEVTPTVGSSLTLAMSINYNGYVGIGTTIPSEKLTVSGNGLFTGTVKVDTVNNGAGDFITRTAGGILTRRTAAEVRTDIGAQAALTDPLTGTGTVNYVSKFTGTGSTLGNSLIFDNGTSVGIGTTNFSTPSFGASLPDLVIANISGPVIHLRNSSTPTSTGQTLGAIEFISTDSSPSFTYLAGRIKAVSNQGASGAASGGSHIIFETSTGTTASTISEKMRIAATGHVGINTTAPDTKLHIEDVTKVLTGNVAGVAQGTLSLVSTDALAADIGPSLVFGGNYITGNSTRIAYAGIAGRKANGGSTNADGYLSFLTWRTTGLTEAMRITPAGFLALGTTVAGVRFVNAGGVASSGPTLGSGYVGSQALVSENGLYGMWSGVSNNGDVWNQVQRNDGNTAAYNLLFNPAGGNVGIGTTSPGVKFVNSGAATASSPTLGSGIVGSNAILTADGSGGLYTGITSGRDVWQQVQRNDTNTSVYGLLLQPLGGNVGIGTLSIGTPSFGATPITTIAGSSSGGILDLRNSSATIGLNAQAGRIQFSVKGGASVGYTNAYISVITAAASSTGDSGGGIMSFATNDGGTGVSPTEKMRIDNLGRVGIGTTSPGFKLHVVGDGGFNSSLYIQDPSPSSYGYLGLLHDSTGSSLYSNPGSSNGSSVVLRLGINNSEKMRIANNGSVAIGTTNVSAPGTGGIAPSLAVGGLSGSVLQLRDMTSITTSGSNLGVIQFVSSYYGTPYAAANIKAVSAQGASGGSSGGANIVFETSTGLTSEVPTERMRLLNDGNLGINQTLPTEKLHINGNLRLTGFFKDSNNLSGTSGQVLSSTGTGTSWITNGGGGGSTPVKLTSQTLAVGSWTIVGAYYTYAFSNVNIDTTSDVSVTPQNASYLTAYNAQVLPFVGVAAGVATFYSQFPPAADMVVDIVITQTA